MNVDLETQRALDRFDEVGVAGLTDEERLLAAVWWFESKVANGGLADFYRSRGGDLASVVPTAFETLGAPALAGIAGRANTVFGPEGVPAEKAPRAEAVRSLPAEARTLLEALTMEYFDYDKDLNDSLERYLTRSRADGHVARCPDKERSRPW